MIIYEKKIEGLKNIIKILFKYEVLGIDTEWGKDKLLHSVQFSAPNEKIRYVIDIRNNENKELCLELLQPLLLSSKVLKIAHNIVAEIVSFKREGIQMRNTYCTYLGELMITGARFLAVKNGYYGLSKVTKRYCGYDIEDKKENQNRIWEEGLSDNEMIRYAANDVNDLIYIYEQQLKKLLELEYIKEDLDTQNIDTLCGLENRAAYYFAECSYQGILVDQKKLNQLKDTINDLKGEKLVELNYEAYKIRGIVEELNWNSPKQKLALLHKINPDIPDTRSETMIKYKEDHKIFALLVEYSKLSSLISKFCNPLSKFIGEEGRISPNFQQMVTTGRVSVSNPPLQQMPSRTKLGQQIRSCFIADEGWKMISCDYSNQELKIIADLSQDPMWISTYNEGKNLHDVICMKTFNLPIEDIKKPAHFNPDITYRSLIKNINFMAAFGGGARKAAKMLNSTVKKGEEFLDNYYSKIPDVKKFLDKAGVDSVKNRYSMTAYYKRRRFYKKSKFLPFFEKLAIIRQGKNQIIQG